MIDKLVLPYGLHPHITLQHFGAAEINNTDYFFTGQIGVTVLP